MEVSKTLIDALKKIPLFKDFSPTQVHQILAICSPKTCKPQEKLCVRGSASQQMYILLSGQLNILSEDGRTVAQVNPVTTVGEIGVITSQPRTATVEAPIPSRILVLQQSHFNLLLRKEPGIKLQIHQNVIRILSDKLVNDNIRMRDYLVEKSRYEHRLAVLEKHLAITRDLLMESGMASGAIDLAISKSLKDSP